SSARLLLSLLPPPPSSTLFPCTTLFRSLVGSALLCGRRGQRTVPVAQRQRARRSRLISVPPWIPEAVRRERVRWEYLTPNALTRSEEHTSELQSRENLVCRLLLEKKKTR